MYLITGYTDQYNMSLSNQSSENQYPIIGYHKQKSRMLLACQVVEFYVLLNHDEVDCDIKTPISLTQINNANCIFSKI